MITEEQFMDTYKPVATGREGEFMLDDFQEAVQFAEARGLTSNHVWTILESGDGDDDALYVSAGYHLVNRLGYIVTEQPWETGIEDAVWMEDDFESDDDEEDEEPVDLFQHQDDLPVVVQTLITNYTRQIEEDEGDSYVLCRYFQKALEPHGYTFDYGLDGVPVDLRRVGP